MYYKNKVTEDIHAFPLHCANVWYDKWYDLIPVLSKASLKIQLCGQKWEVSYKNNKINNNNYY